MCEFGLRGRVLSIVAPVAGQLEYRRRNTRFSHGRGREVRMKEDNERWKREWISSDVTYVFLLDFWRPPTRLSPPSPPPPCSSPSLVVGAAKDMTTDHLTCKGRLQGG